MYKVSEFNLEVDALPDGKKLMYNTISRVLVVMDVEAQTLLETVSSGVIVSPNAIEDEKTRTLLETMVSTGFIVDAEYNERNILKFGTLRAAFDKTTLALTIATTLDCNMACPYCYEKRCAVKKEGMGQDVQESLFEFAKRYIEANHCKTMYVTWYGGEPLLNADAVYNLSEKFIVLCKEKEVTYQAFIITNGYYLDLDTAKKLSEECKVSFAQISIDGMPEHHNTSRALVDGSPSFDTIVANIEQAKEIINIAVRVNVDNNNADKIEELKQLFLVEKGWGKTPTVYFSRIRDYNKCIQDTSCYMSEDKYSSFEFALTKERYEQGEDIRQVYPTYKDVFCGAQRIGNYVIDPEGYIYTCWNHVGVIDENCGNVKEGLKPNKNYLKWILFEDDSVCQTCKFYPVCKGGCPYDYMQEGSPNCIPWVHNYKNNLKLAHLDHVNKAVTAT